MKKKVLLMGKSGSGKTSMRSIVFANYVAKDTRRLGATIDIERSHVQLMGNLVLHLWDCSGQETYYLHPKQKEIFKNVEVLIYVFDTESYEDHDMDHYKNCLIALNQYSQHAKVVCLLHKIDLLPRNYYDEIIPEREADLVRNSKPFAIEIFQTSIWNGTLYKAWSQIVQSQIPIISTMQNFLLEFADTLDADEVLLFEKNTFLIVASCVRKPHTDARRFEKVSNIIKQFKLSCAKLAAQFHSMEVRNSKYTIIIDYLTPFTYIMVCTTDVNITSELIKINIRYARKKFTEIESTLV